MHIRKMVLCAMFSALLCICGWIAVPVADISITMQTFGIFLVLLLLGGKYGTISILIYLALGAAGVPVFSGFRGGIGVLLGPTGGYIWGFGILGLTYWLLTRIFRKHSFIPLFALLCGLALCYLLGSLWYLHAYLDHQHLSLAAVLTKCVIPYILPDLIKLFLAQSLAKRLIKYI